MAALQERQAEVVNEEEEEQQGGPFPIEALQEVGVAAADIKKLKEGGEQQRPAEGCSVPALQRSRPLTGRSRVGTQVSTPLSRCPMRASASCRTSRA